MLGDLFFRVGLIYVFILAGIVLKRLLKSAPFISTLFSKLLINFFVPVVVFTSLLRFSETIIDFGVSIFSVLIFFFSSVVAYLFAKMLQRNEKNVGPYVLASIYPNGFYLPFPIVYALFGVDGLSYSTIYLLIANVAATFYVYPLYSYYSSYKKLKDFQPLKKLFFFPPFVASILGFAFLSFGLTLPPHLVQPTAYFGQLTTYIALLFVGLHINLEKKDWLSKPIAGVVMIRLLIVPVIIFSVMKVFALRELWSMVLLIHSGMPPAVNNIIFADNFGLNKGLMATIVAEATALTLVTLPLLIFLGRSL